MITPTKESVSKSQTNCLCLTSECHCTEIFLMLSPLIFLICSLRTLGVKRRSERCSSKTKSLKINSRVCDMWIMQISCDVTVQSMFQITHLLRQWFFIKIIMISEKEVILILSELWVWFRSFINDWAWFRQCKVTAKPVIHARGWKHIRTSHMIICCLYQSSINHDRTYQ